MLVLLEGLLFLLLAVVAFSLTRFDRSDPVYVWMGSVFLLITTNSILVYYRYLDTKPRRDR